MTNNVSKFQEELKKKFFLSYFRPSANNVRKVNVKKLLRTITNFMKVITSIANEYCSITLFLWNQKYILKFEQSYLEQTYKFSELDFLEEEIKSLATQSFFIEKVLVRFKEMQQDLRHCLENNL